MLKGLEQKLLCEVQCKLTGVEMKIETISFQKIRFGVGTMAIKLYVHVSSNY